MNTTETQLEFDFNEPDQLSLKLDWKNTIFLAAESSSPQLLIKPEYSVSFYRESQLIGKLDWNDGPMKFEGNAEESAQLFFDNIIERYTQNYIKFDNPS